jgi:hypothetical protein
MKRYFILIALFIVFLAHISFAEDNSEKKEETIRELIIRLNNEYLSLNESLRKLEKNIWDFPSTALNLSVIKRGSDIKLISLEVLDNNVLLKSHFYTSFENEALESGGRHQFYSKEINGGNRSISVIYYWSEKDKQAQKGEMLFPIYIPKGKDTFIEFSFEKIRDKLELKISQIAFKE